ncbi:MAG: alpha/beta hydrolase [Blastocatellia bacterium]
MLKNRSVITLYIILAVLLGAPGSEVLAQTGQQNSQTRSPDPAAVRQAPVMTFRAPEEIDFRTASIISEGVRLHAEIFSLKTLAGKKLPTVLMAHGYRGWGQSDSRLILTGASPVKPISGQSQKFTAEVVEVREVVDPLEFVTDWFNAIHWAMGEPMVDKDRLGLRGSSYSGGHIVHVAAHDPRVKAIVSQVGAMDSRPKAFTTLAGTEEQQLKTAYDEATRRARGELGYPEPRKRGVYGNLIGAPIRDKLLRAGFVEDAARLTNCAALFIDAEKEELFDNKDHARLVYERMPGKDKKYVLIPAITHYGIYRESYDQAIKLAIEWFDQYLKK